jgi:hypothetical protein
MNAPSLNNTTACGHEITFSACVTQMCNMKVTVIINLEYEVLTAQYEDYGLLVVWYRSTNISWETAAP